MKYFSKKYVSLYFAFLVIGVIGFICLQLDFHTIRKLQAKHQGKVLNMFVQENTVTVVQEFHRPLPKMPDEPDSSQEDLSKKLPKNCQPQTKLAFAKTHKTGGSTLQNILLRYGYKNGLTFAIPIKNWMFSFDELFNANMVTRYDWNPDNQFDMMAFHSLWNGPQVDLVIPKPSKRITLLRDPVDTFESGFVYMGLAKSLKMNINEYAQWIKKKHFPMRKPRSWFDKDELLWDLGADVSQLEKNEYLRDRIEVYENEFDLVLIAERFDESLVLLQDLLCWDTEDVTYLMQNERDAQFKNTTITPESRLILQQWLSGDYQLYNYFNHQLGEKLKQLGTQVVDENLKALRDSNRKLKESCNAHFVDNESLKGTPLHMAHHMVKAYDLAENCIYFAMAEPAFYNQIKKQQKAGKPTPQNISKSKAKR